MDTSLFTLGETKWYEVRTVEGRPGGFETDETVTKVFAKFTVHHSNMANQNFADVASAAFTSDNNQRRYLTADESYIKLNGKNLGSNLMEIYQSIALAKANEISFDLSFEDNPGCPKVNIFLTKD